MLGIKPKPEESNEDQEENKESDPDNSKPPQGEPAVVVEEAKHEELQIPQYDAGESNTVLEAEEVPKGEPVADGATEEAQDS